MVEDNQDIDGLLILLNTVGGDVEAGLAIAEMIGIPKQTYRISCSGRGTFYRGAYGRIRRLFLYRAKCDYGHTSGSD